VSCPASFAFFLFIFYLGMRSSWRMTSSDHVVVTCPNTA
jgi:hypothetical protein